jgi:hypothetical protein
MGSFDYLLGANPVQVPNPLSIAQQGMSLAALANQSKLAQYEIAQKQRADAAANSYNASLGNIDFSNPQSVQSAIQNADPAARPLIIKGYLDYQKNQADVGEKQSGTVKNLAQARNFASEATKNSLTAASGLAADAARNGTDPAQVQASAKAMGLDPAIFAVPDGIDPRQYYASVASGSINAAKQADLQAQGVSRAETQRHNLATEGAQATTNAIRQQQAKIAAAQADPFGILGINNGQSPQPVAPTPAGSVPNGVSAAQQMGRDQQRLALLQQERATQAASGQVDPALEAEIAQTQRNLSAGTPFAGGQAPNPLPPSMPSGQMSVRDAMTAGLHGDDFLKVLPPAVASQVKMLAEGKMQVPAGASLRNPQINQLIQLAAQYDPTFDAVDYQTRYKTAQDFAPQGKSGQNITALNTAMGHLAGLRDAMGKLDNFGGAATPLNAPINAIEQYFGDPRQTDVAMHANAVAGELAKVFRSTGMSEADINSWKSQLGQNLSPEQQAQVIKSGIDLMNSRLEAIGDAYTRGMGKVSNGVDLLSPDAQKAYATLTGGEKPPAKAYTPDQRAQQARQVSQAAPNRDALIQQALDAISKGAPRDKVLARLQQMGVTDARI